MKAQHWLIALIVFFTCSTVVSANTTLDGLTQDDGITALQAGDSMGFEVIPRSELEEVRGEALPVAVVAALGVISYYALVYGVPFALNYAASLTTGSWYVKHQVKEKVKQHFGW